MYQLLIVIIYLAYISLGLPDSLLGSAWPTMRGELGAPLSYAGIVTMIIAGGTIVSSLSSDALTKKLGTGLVAALSVLFTATALFGFSLSGAFWMLCAWAVPYGLGAGAIDAALNNYVALHYSSRHMNWLHCFWGVGAAASPFIMGHALTGGLGWEGGYRTVAVVQVFFTAMLFAALPVWRSKKLPGGQGLAPPKTPAVRLRDAVKVEGVGTILVAFFGYCSVEATAGLWASSYLVLTRGVEAGAAARYASWFYLGITGGRFLCGFVADRVGDRGMIRYGVLLTFVGIALLWAPTATASLAGLIATGLGCAPVFPAIIHATPDNFGKENSQAIIGIQMASAYTGITFMPLLFGLIAGRAGIALYPAFLAVFALLILVMTERLNKKTMVK
ncbi:MAG: MFS transporter [Clostridiales Family XIII bacterium]|nr:MFS transporter [Clostridiales Family XIII bacterium]